MKISNISKKIKMTIGTGTIVSLMAFPVMTVKGGSEPDVFEKENKIENSSKNKSLTSKILEYYNKNFSNKIPQHFVFPPASGSSSEKVLACAPSPEVKVQNKNCLAKFVVDLTHNVLYHYDSDGNPLTAYLVASGKSSTPTPEGVKVVSYTEVYPYDRAPMGTKRKEHPWNYGPRIIILDGLNTETGEKYSQGIFIHGHRENTGHKIGKFVSGGCIRMDNEVIKKLAKVVKRGDLVLFKRF